MSEKKSVEACKHLYVGNMNYDATDEQISESLGAAAGADVVKVFRPKNKDTGHTKGFCFIRVKNGDVQKFLTLNDKTFMKRKITINIAKDREIKNSIPLVSKESSVEKLEVTNA